MQENNPSTLSSIAWAEVFPWLKIFRAFRPATSFSVMLLGAIAILITVSGWWFFGQVFSGDPQTDPEAIQWMESYHNCPWNTVIEAVPDSPTWPQFGEVPSLPGSREPLFGVWAQLTEPLAGGFFNPEITLPGAACLLLCGLWSLATWAFFGAAISRIAAVRLTCDERIGMMAALRYACKKWRSYAGAPLLVVVGILLAAIPGLLVGAVLMNANWSVLVAAILWPVVLVAGLVMAVLLLGLIFGWPLMWATISTEGTDSFDALSRSYAYTFGRPLHYLFYAVVAAVVGSLGWILVANFAGAVVGLSYWAAGWGCGHEQVQLIIEGETKTLGAMLIRFWAGCVKFLAAGFFYGYFWTAITAIYLVLRRDVDATEMDEVYLDEDESEQQFGLPPIGTDEAGAPEVSEDVPEVEPDAEPEEPGTT